jgi:hypothetical protein
MLDVLFSIVRDDTASPAQRRRAAVAVAQHFLPKTPGKKKVPVDEYGFAIAPEIAVEFRDVRLKYNQLLERRGSNHLTVAEQANKLEARMEKILLGLQCPCPSRYGVTQREADGKRLETFVRKRERKVFLTEADIAEAHVLARTASFERGPEQKVRRTLKRLRKLDFHRQEWFGEPLTSRQQNDMRWLGILYPTPLSIELNPEFVETLPGVIDGNPNYANGGREPAAPPRQA